MKNFWKFFGVITLVVVAGFFMVSCGSDDDSVVYRDIMGSVVLESGSQGVAGNKEVTRLAGGIEYVVLIFGADGYAVEGTVARTRPDGTLQAEDDLSDAITNAAALDFRRTRIRGLENEGSGFSYSVFKVITEPCTPLTPLGAPTVDPGDSPGDNDVTLSRAPIVISDENAIIDTRGRNVILDIAAVPTQNSSADSAAPISTAFTIQDLVFEIGPGAGIPGARITPDRFVEGGTTIIFHLPVGEEVVGNLHNAALTDDLVLPLAGGNVDVIFSVDEVSTARINAIEGDRFFEIIGITDNTEFTLTFTYPE